LTHQQLQLTAGSCEITICLTAMTNTFEASKK